ncbi:hypothetical protein B0T22DRAFT_420728 [Podospora appendiculata]|uniref:Endo-chitosanase n=1 Tax=Podospora appendiculata TaxID=314037 RepID=A0AAE0XHN0_9PEZI|nr:hypothetical protein B0T22DRAFT_420728 [Podospora appendiculata]
MPRLITRHLLILLAAWCGASTARDVPANIREFYNAVRRNGSCANQLATGFWATEPGASTFSYCGDHMPDYGVLYIQGRGGSLADRDIDCDGIQGGPGDDGRCDAVASPDLQLATSFQDEVASYGKGINGGHGHSQEDVLYMAFAGPEAVPGARGARWDAKSYEEFERSVEGLGDRLVKRIGGVGKDLDMGAGAGAGGRERGSEGSGETYQGGRVAGETYQGSEGPGKSDSGSEFAGQSGSEGADGNEGGDAGAGAGQGRGAVENGIQEPEANRTVKVTVDLEAVATAVVVFAFWVWAST